MGEIEMALEEQIPSKVEVALDKEQQHGHLVVIESNTDLDDINEEVEESIQLSRKDILNSTNLDESLSITSSLRDDTADMLTKVYHE